MRGLKYDNITSNKSIIIVAPHVGAWIEIGGFVTIAVRKRVAPHVGAWIEIA